MAIGWCTRRVGTCRSTMCVRMRTHSPLGGGRSEEEEEEGAHVAGCTQPCNTRDTHGAPVSRVRNEFEGCAGCVRGRIVRVGYVQTRILLFASPLVPLWPVENDTFRNCAVSLCEGTCRERAQSRAWYTRVNGYEEKRGLPLTRLHLIIIPSYRWLYENPFSNQVSCSICSLPLSCFCRRVNELLRLLVLSNISCFFFDQISGRNP